MNQNLISYRFGVRVIAEVERMLGRNELTFDQFFTRVLRDSTSRFVRWLVGWSVGRSHFTFFYDFFSLTSQLLPKWSSDLKYGPCPPTRDFGSCVSGLVFIRCKD